jgi:UDP-glucose 4-epimerase
VSDAVAANLAALRHPAPTGGEVFNVGTGQQIRLLDLVSSLNTVLGTNLEIEFQQSRAGDVHESLASLEQISRVLGYRPRVSFEEGLRQTVAASRFASRD